VKLSQLNGLNGEATNKDDPKGKDGKNANRRVNKKKKYGPKDDEKKDDDELEQMPEIRFVVMYFGDNLLVPIYGLGEKGRLVTTRVVAGVYSFFDCTGLQYFNIARDGDVKQVKLLSSGFYETTSDTIQMRLDCPFERRYLTDNAGKFREMRAFTLLKPLLATLKHRFPGMKFSVENMKACDACANKDYPDIPAHIKADTILYHFEMILASEALLLSNNRITAELAGREMLKPEHERTIIPTYDSANVDSYIQCGVDPKFQFITHDIGVENMINDDTDNHMFQITKSNGFELDRQHSLRGYFKTNLVAHHRWYRTTFVQFRSHIPEKVFQLYDNTPTTAVNALARLYKARPLENELRYNQMLLTDVDSLPELLEVVSNTKYSAMMTHARHQFEGMRVFDQQFMLLVNSQVRARWGPGNFGFLRRLFYQGKCWAWTLGCFPKAIYYATDYIASQLYNGVLDLCNTRRSFAESSLKQKLYLRYFREMFSWHSEEPVPVGVQPELKVKFETGKVGKLARLFVSYGGAIMFGGWVYNYLKSVLCRTWYNKLYYSSKHEIYKMLGDLPMSTECDAEFPASGNTWIDDNSTEVGLHTRSFSDDLEGVLVRRGKPRMLFTFDIRSCDTTNGPGNFLLLGEQLTQVGLFKTFSGFMHVLRQPLRLTNPIERSEYIDIEPKTMFMGSGDGSTTHANNIYQSNNVLCMQSALHVAEHIGWRFPDSDEKVFLDDMDNNQVIAMFDHAISFNGCTGEFSIKFNNEESDFLKTFACRSKCGASTSMLCLGAVLRNFGKVRGDLDATQLGVSTSVFAKMSNTERAERFLSGVVAGLCNEPRNIVLDALRLRFKVPAKKINERYWADDDRSHLEISLESLQCRYGCTDYEWVQLAKEIENMVLGSVISHPVITAIFAKDYSL